MIEILQRFLLKSLLRIVFILFSINRINRDLVVFADANSYNIPDNIYPIYKLLKSKGFHCKKICFHNESGKLALIKNYIIFTINYAKAGYVIVADYFMPLYFNHPRKETKVIQAWHAGGAFKKWGYASIDNSWGQCRKMLKLFPIHGVYTHVLVTSPQVIKNYAEALNVAENCIYPLGMSRTDVFFQPSFIESAKNKLHEHFPQIGSRKVILYAPTFRDSKEKEFNNKLDFEYLYAQLKNEYVIIIKLHPFSGTLTVPDAYSSFIFKVSSFLKIDEALCASDVLLSDYSSLVFEYALLERPIIFFAYDLEDYIKERGLFYQYEDFVPGPIARTNAQIVKHIQNHSDTFDSSKIVAFKEKFMSACDGNCTNRIINELFYKK